MPSPTAAVVIRAWGLALVLVLGLSAGASAEPGPSPASLAAWQLSRELMSPFCPGRTLATCPSPAAGELRDEIASRFAAGETRDALVADLVTRFGDAIRGAPEPTGAGILVWIVPGLAGGLLVWLVATNVAVGGRTPDEPAGSTATTEDASRRRHLDDELAAMD